MKGVCHTSQSLIKSVCYPEVFSFTSKETSWGYKHEKEFIFMLATSRCLLTSEAEGIELY